MKPYAPETAKGRNMGGHDIHHRTADQPKGAAKISAKAARKAARRDARVQVATAVQEHDNSAEELVKVLLPAIPIEHREAAASELAESVRWMRQFLSDERAL